jgi:hypothetical protein
MLFAAANAATSIMAERVPSLTAAQRETGRKAHHAMKSEV